MHSYPGYWGNQSLRESPVPGLSIRVECARRNTQGLCPIPSSFLPYPCLLDTSQFLQHHAVEGAFIHRCGHRKEGGWRWEPHHQEAWNPGGFSKLFQCRGSTSFGCRRCSFTAGGPAWIWRLWVGAEGNRHTTSMGPGSLAGISSPPSSVPRQSIQGTQACSGFRDVTAA